MKRLLFFFVILIVSIAASSYLIGEKGYILIAMGDYTIESTVVTAGFFLTITFLVLLLVLKILKHGLNFSIGSWHKIRFASQRRGLRQFQQGVTAYALGDFKQAEQLLVDSTKRTKFDKTAYLIAASAAQQQNNAENAKHYLEQLPDISIKEGGIESLLITLQLHMAQKNYGQARELLDQFHKHIGHDDRLLAQDIELSLIEQRYLHAMEALVKARKSKVLTEQQIERWESSAAKGAFNEKIIKEDQQALNTYWNNLPKKVKQRETVLLAYCHVLAEQQLTKGLEDILLPAIKKQASPSFIKAIRAIPLQHNEALIAAIQKHLHKDPKSAQWLSLLAHFSAASQQWDMAEKAFNSLFQQDEVDLDDIRVFAEVLKQQGKPDHAVTILQKAIG